MLRAAHRCLPLPQFAPRVMRGAGVALLLILLASGCDATDPLEPDAVEITLLVAYTTEAEVATPDIAATVRQALDVTNAIYRRGHIPVRLALAHMARVDYAMTVRRNDLKRLVGTADGGLDTLHVLRDRHQADVVVLVPDKPSATINAAIMAEPATAFLIVHWEHLGAPSYGLAHELGHLMGARHSSDADPAVEPFAYGHGFRNGTLRTIMANGSEERVAAFSGPDQQHNGVVLGDSARHDVARVLRETAAYIAGFRGPRIPTDFEPPGTWPVLDFNTP